MPLSPVSRTVEARLAGNLLQQRADGDHRIALADDAIQAERLRLTGAKRPHFPPQRRRLECLLDEQHDLVEIERLVGVVIRAGLHGVDRRVDAHVRGQQDHERVGIGLLDLLEDRQAVGIRQPIVEQHQIGAFPMALDGLGACFCFQDAIAFVGESAGQTTSGSASRRRR